jgi:competence protein ComEC
MEPVGEGAIRVTTGLSDINNQGDGGQTAPLITPKSWAPSLAGASAFVGAEIAAQASRWFLWSPVALGLGCGLYLALPREPVWWQVLLPALLALTSAVAARRWGGSRSLSIATALIAMAALGLLAGKVRTEMVRAPVAPVTGAVSVTAWVVDVASPGNTGQRLILAPQSIGDLPPEALPARLRITVKGNLFGPGTPVRFRGLINPPPTPASPGAYDFARNAYFDQIGGVGVALSDLQIVDLPQPASWSLRLAMGVNAFRWGLSQKIAAAMTPSSAGLGVAMITGHEAWVNQDTENSLRDAGLAHIISISGVHMAIVGGFIFMAVRLGVAAWPWLALRVPGKKVAAATGLLSIIIYLIVSGSPPPAERSAITAVVAFGAILADRRAITLRALAIAAVLILLIQPEAVAEAGFQMSFAATAALVALAEVWVHPAREIHVPWPIRLAQGAAFWLIASMAASFVAGAATGPFAIQDFNRVALYGLPANLFEEPLSAFVIMPFLAVGAALQTVGLGGPFLFVAGFGIDTLDGMAAWFAKLPHATMLIASAPDFTLPVSFLGMLWVFLWKGRLRWLGLPAALIVSLWPRPEAPIAWIASDGGAAAVRSSGQAILMRPEAKLFGAQLWAHHRGLVLPDDPAAAQAGMFDCSRNGCRALYGDAVRISAWWSKRRPKDDVLDDLCASSDILAIKAEVDLPESCHSVRVLTAADFAKGGAAEVYADGHIVWAQPFRGKRPWTRTGDDED